jgi:methionyl-tRNA synthetase
MLDDVHTDLMAVRLRAGIARAMQGAQDANAYLSDREPWKTATVDAVRTGTTLWVALQAIAAAAVAMAPYLPGTSRSVLEALGVGVGPDGPAWDVPVVESGTSLGDLGPLFAKVELDTEE